MAYRHLDNIDSKIIEETIRIGSENGANHLSTKEIAKACLISEFVIYDHFKTKSLLIEAAEEVVDEEVLGAFQKEALKKPSLEELYLASLEYFLSHLRYAGYLINYGKAFPSVTPRNSLSEHIEQLLTDSETVFYSLYPMKPNATQGNHYYGLVFLRSVVEGSVLLASGQIKDTDANRILYAQTQLKGLSHFIGN